MEFSWIIPATLIGILGMKAMIITFSQQMAEI